ncbi:CHAD domain-containing protein [Tabrizicola oligotrophica]|uniref:CHAD domain-containing protein n=1 Tax=Tabrizicola oligotrophica TaxID=2710650 RepID=A0A6M0QUT2_9RHOB|nr:CHAD domain-containing protein [Tabrizicola oligotrophica]NEY91248.1 CHAD domain-containing protein [Tabrizicola oligotrophica]
MESAPIIPWIDCPPSRGTRTLRRLRAALKAFHPILDEDLADTLQDKSRALFRILGEVRDADVMALRFAEAQNAEATRDEAAHQRRRARKHLKRKKAEGFRTAVLRRLAGKGWRRGGKKAGALREAPVAVQAKAALNRAWAACLGNGPDLRQMRARTQHELRKDLKMLRYLTEFFEDLWPGAAQERFLATLRTLQDDLGEMTDTALARSLGHDDPSDLAPPQERAAQDWQALQAQGPWWQPVPAVA